MLKYVRRKIKQPLEKIVNHNNNYKKKEKQENKKKTKTIKQNNRNQNNLFIVQGVIYSFFSFILFLFKSKQVRLTEVVWFPGLTQCPGGYPVPVRL
jgi:hypothetical protein